MSAEAKQLDNFKNPAKKSGQAKLDYRDSIEEAPQPRAGFATAVVEEIIQSGASGVRNAQRCAMRHARRALIESCDEWKRDTPYLQALREGTDRSQRACARLALTWRPRFLAALSITHAPSIAARHARVAVATVYRHREADKDFAGMWEQAQAHALELLHARVWQRSLEGDVEPVYFMGVRVGWIRKFDSKLQIELLRAWSPDRFRSAGVNINLAARGDVFLLTEEQRHELRALNRAWLLDDSTRAPSVVSEG
jgi:hypothetical protein